jgi:hypothetical protein
MHAGTADDLDRICFGRPRWGGRAEQTAADEKTDRGKAERARERI